MERRIPTQTGRFRGIRRLLLLGTFVLFVVALYRTFHMPPPNPAPEFEVFDPAAEAAPSVPPPPPLPADQKRRRARVPSGTISNGSSEAEANEAALIREYAAAAADPGSRAMTVLTAAVEPLENPANASVIVAPPERKEDSRGWRWIKAVGKALHIVSQKETGDDVFGASPSGE